VRIWIALLDIPEDVIAKINQKHELTEKEIRDEIQCVTGLNATADNDDTRGFRWFVEVVIRGDDYVAVLRPNPWDNDRYKLLTCYKLP
jgi:hypothetical protein